MPAVYFLRTFKNLIDNRHGFLCARIIRGDHRKIAQPCGDFAHQRSLFGIAVTTAAKDTDDSVGGNGPQGANDIFQCIGCVGIIHIHEPAAIVFNTLQTTRYGRYGVYAGVKVVGRQIQRPPNAGRAQNIFEVVRTDKLGFKIKFSTGCLNFSRNAVQVTFCTCVSNGITRSRPAFNCRNLEAICELFAF